MAVYAIGDIQGCYDALRRLLDKIEFEPGKDTLWIAGDMVNRGPDSLATLRFLKSIKKHCVAVLGNHDLHLLAVADNIRGLKKKDTLMPILKAPDADELLEWLRFRPVLHHDPKRKMTMVHAGIPPIWNLKQAIIHAQKLEKALRSDDYQDILRYLFRNDSINSWETALTRKARLKMIAAYFTRMRFCDAHGRLDFENKGGLVPARQSKKASYQYAPWFSFPESPMYHKQIIIGHWAALDGYSGCRNIHALDTGCVWGGRLTAMNLKTFKRISVRS